MMSPTRSSSPPINDAKIHCVRQAFQLISEHTKQNMKIIMNSHRSHWPIGVSFSLSIPLSISLSLHFSIFFGAQNPKIEKN